MIFALFQNPLRLKSSRTDTSSSAQRADSGEAGNSSSKRKRNRRKKHPISIQEGLVERKSEDQPLPASVSSSILPHVQEAHTVQSSEEQMNCSTSSIVANPPSSKKSNKKRKSGGGEIETVTSPGVQRLTSKQVPVSVCHNVTTGASALQGAHSGLLSSKDLELIFSASNIGPIYSASSFPCCVTVTSSKSSSQLPSQRLESSHLYGGSSFSTTSPIVAAKPAETMSAPPAVQKSREEIEAERKARKAAKAAAKGKPKGNEKESIPSKPVDKEPNISNKKESVHKVAPSSSPTNPKSPKGAVEKITENVKNLKVTDAKQAPNKRTPDEPDFARSTSFAAPVPVEDVIPAGLKEMMSKEGAEKSKAELRAERRAKQEAQRAAKAQQQAEKVKVQQQTQQQKVPPPSAKPVPVDSSSKGPEKTTPTKLVKEVKDVKAERRVKLFSHLYQNSFKNFSHTIGVSHPEYHLSIVRLGVQYANRVVLGSNARCLALLYSLKELIADYETPPQKEFSRGLEAYLQPNMDFLQKCRPHSVSMVNALRYIKWQLTQISIDKSDAEARQHVLEAIDQYIDDQIGKAAEAIGKVVKDKIDDNDVILVYACSSLVLSALKVAFEANRKFHVIVVDSQPWLEGREMLRRLVSMGVQCSYVHLSAASFVMRKVSKVLLGAHALLANGYVMSRAGSSQIALLAHAYNVPVLVCCETHKFSERVQTDSFVYNELADPDELIGTKRSGERETERERPLANWRNIPSLSLLNLVYDVTPPDLVTAVVTERAILPCTSVPVILRIKPTEC